MRIPLISNCSRSKRLQTQGRTAPDTSYVITPDGNRMNNWSIQGGVNAVDGAKAVDGTSASEVGLNTGITAETSIKSDPDLELPEFLPPLFVQAVRVCALFRPSLSQPP